MWLVDILLALGGVDSRRLEGCVEACAAGAELLFAYSTTPILVLSLSPDFIWRSCKSGAGNWMLEARRQKRTFA